MRISYNVLLSYTKYPSPNSSKIHLPSPISYPSDFISPPPSTFPIPAPIMLPPKFMAFSFFNHSFYIYNLKIKHIHRTCWVHSVLLSCMFLELPGIKPLKKTGCPSISSSPLSIALQLERRCRSYTHYFSPKILGFCLGYAHTCLLHVAVCLYVTLLYCVCKIPLHCIHPLSPQLQSFLPLFCNEP